MERKQNRITPESATDEPGSPSNANDNAASGIAFDPVPVRERIDGITPAKQREFVEALADTGLVNVAAARIGVSEQCVARLRRRADARSFDLACHAARRIGARRLHALAWERAIEGTVKRHYYHGELVSEERVFDNKLLIYLLGKTEHLLDEPEEASEAVRNWQPFVEAMEHGLPPPGEQGGPDEVAPCDDDEPDRYGGHKIIEEEDGWWTTFPPPAGFDGREKGEPGDCGYKRTLTDAEQAVIDADFAAERGETLVAGCAHRDRYFGFAGGLPDGLAEDEVFFPMEAEPSEPSPERGAQQSSEPVASRRERPGDGSAEPSPIDVTGMARDGVPRIPKIAPGERSTSPWSGGETGDRPDA